MEKPYRAHLLRSKYNHTRLFIPRTRRRSLSCGNHHSSGIAFVNTAIFWQCGLRWFTLRPINPHNVLAWVHIRGHDIPLKCVNRFLLSEFSYNASSVWSGVIVHKDRPVSQWEIVKMGYNVCLKHVFGYERHWGFLARHTSLTYN